ncbi:MAG: FG-GAP-like repeat-containing protein [Planctomycetota bacterium]
MASVAVLPGGWFAGPGGDDWRTTDPVVGATNRGVALMERYEYAEAVKSFEEAVKLAPDSPELRVNLAIAVYNRSAKGDLEQAEKLLDEVVRAQPDNARAWYVRGITHQYSGRDEQAVACFETVLRLAPGDAWAWYLLARSKAHLGRPYRADLERAVRENPALASAYYDLMRLAVQEGDQDKTRVYQEEFERLRQSPLADMVVMPHYRQVGPLAVVQPSSDRPQRNVAGGELTAGPVRTLLEGFGVKAAPPAEPAYDTGLALADVNEDGHLDMAVVVPVDEGRRRVALLLGRPDGRFTEATEGAGLAGVRGALSCAFGDFDNDNHVDLFVSCAGPNYLFRGRGDGTFEDVTEKTRTAGPNGVSVSAVFLDADHDGDLDIYVCNASAADGVSPAANQLLNNNADGTFTDIAAAAGVACPTERSVMLAPADLDGDRDTDLIVFNESAPARVFFNDRLGKYHEERVTGWKAGPTGSMTDEPVHGDHGGLVQDFNGDGRPDLLVLPGPRTTGRLYLSDGGGTLKPSPQFDGGMEAIGTWGRIHATRVADMDLDGDLDIVIFGRAGHVLLNNGVGQFVAKTGVWPLPPEGTVIATELADWTADGLPDLLLVSSSGNGRVELVPTQLSPPANWLAVTPTGHRGEDRRTRSPASGFGTRVEVRCGLHSQVLSYTGLGGGLSQSQRPLVFGLHGATKADYLAFVWPDGVTQFESEVAARTHHRISELERRVSSCPVLFAWNGERFGFVGDFAGVGGLGYFVAPGKYAVPQALEQVKIEPQQLVARDGMYELRICEPMEEVAYVDRLELLAVDHPLGVSVYPDERLAFTGPPPTHRLLYAANPIFPARATGPNGIDCVDRVTEVDRVYAYQPKLDRRFCGFCEPHTLVLDFADKLAGIGPEQRVYLFIHGWIEYPYSQTTFAAAQAGVIWQPMKIERQADDDRWETVVPDAGAPGGMARTIAIDLTGKLTERDCRLRISTNLEIYYDQAFIAADRGTEDVAIRTVPAAQADLSRLGFPSEYSPDSRHPTIYTYDVIEPTSSFKMPRGAYTRYGPVEELLAEFDDRHVILGSGDEIALRFDARELPPLGAGMVRSFILVSHAYCKDMDLYTAEPDTVEPLPFGAMSAYPYPPSERYPEGDEFRVYQERFNTRLRP